MKHHIVTLGGAMYDIFLRNPGHIKIFKEDAEPYLGLPEGRKLPVEDIHYALGGGALNTSVSFHRQGHHVTPLFKVGRDALGAALLDLLTQEGIALQQPHYHPSLATGVSCIISLAGHDSTLFAYRGANTALSLDDIPANLWDKTTLLYCTSFSGAASTLLPLVVKKARPTVTCIALNPGEEQIEEYTETLIEAFPSLDVLILNRHEAQQLMRHLLSRHSRPEQYAYRGPIPLPGLLQHFITHAGISYTLNHFFQLVRHYGINYSMVTNGPHGVYVGTQENIFFYRHETTALTNTVGAGDACGSTFVAHIAAGWPVEEALIRAAINSSAVLHGKDATSGLLSQEALELAAKRILPSKVCCYTTDILQ